MRLRILNLAACSHTARDIENDRIGKAVEHIVFLQRVSGALVKFHQRFWRV